MRLLVVPALLLLAGPLGCGAGQRLGPPPAAAPAAAAVDPEGRAAALDPVAAAALAQQQFICGDAAAARDSARAALVDPRQRPAMQLLLGKLYLWWALATQDSGCLQRAAACFAATEGAAAGRLGALLTLQLP